MVYLVIGIRAHVALIKRELEPNYSIRAAFYVDCIDKADAL